MILTLCGSARFEPIWHEVSKQLGLAGHHCFSLMTYPSIEGAKTWYSDDQKWMLDLMHFAKIEDSHGVVMLNCFDYLGESSTRELQWARIRSKTVFWLFASGATRIKRGEQSALDLMDRAGVSAVLEIQKNLKAP